MLRRSFLLAVPALALAMTGCSNFSKAPEVSSSPLEDGIIHAADRVRAQLANRGLLGEEPILVLTFQELRSLSDTLGFGKVCAEQAASRLVETGLRVVDLRYTGSISINERNGETVLSREATKLAASHKVKVILTGTYVVLGADARVSMRAVSAADGVVLASADFRIPAESVRRLLG